MGWKGHQRNIPALMATSTANASSANSETGSADGSSFGSSDRSHFTARIGARYISGRVRAVNETQDWPKNPDEVERLNDSLARERPIDDYDTRAPFDSRWHQGR